MSKGDREFSLEIARSKGHQALSLLYDDIHHGEIVGSIARDHPFVHDIDLLVIPREASPVSLNATQVAKRLGEQLDIPINIFTVPVESWEPGLIHWTIGRAVVHLKREARARGYVLNQYGLFDQSGPVVSYHARQIYRMLETGIPDCLERLLDS